jgi:hypothetical protein
VVCDSTHSPSISNLTRCSVVSVGVSDTFMMVSGLLVIEESGDAGSQGVILP